MSLLSLFKSKDSIIEFLVDEADIDVIPPPVPAMKHMPAWFKDVRPHVLDGARDHIGAPAMAVKKCSPMIDGMSLGFIIPLWADLHVTTDDKGTMIKCERMTPYGPIAEFHSPSQLNGVGKMSPAGDQPAIKFINRIVIKTAPGFSALIVPPLGVFESRFECLPALVDTDTYVKQINFPAIWRANGYEGTVTAGTPLVTIIPVRRADMQRDLKYRVMTPAENKRIHSLQMAQATRRGVYTDELREKRK